MYFVTNKPGGSPMFLLDTKDPDSGVNFGDKVGVKGKGVGVLESIYEDRINVRMPDGDLVTVGREELELAVMPKVREEEKAKEDSEPESAADRIWRETQEKHKKSKDK